MYLSGTMTEFFKNSQVYGIMFNIARACAREQEALELGCKFGIDNGVFSNKFNERDWLTRLMFFLPYRHNCLVCPLPDYLDYLPEGCVMGDWRKTLDRFYQYKQVTRRLGFPVTLVTQDGLTVDNTPWPELDAIFIGGSNYHKRGLEAERLGLAAKRRGLYVHIGRVSAISTAKKYWPWADSYDGTVYRYSPDVFYKNYTPQWERFFNDEDKHFQLKLI